MKYFSCGKSKPTDMVIGRLFFTKKTLGKAINHTIYPKEPGEDFQSDYLNCIHLDSIISLPLASFSWVPL
jgi:hypothetical protein